MFIDQKLSKSTECVIFSQERPYEIHDDCINYTHMVLNAFGIPRCLSRCLPNKRCSSFVEEINSLSFINGISVGFNGGFYSDL